ncbi:YihY family inner membrane protein [Oxalobacter vibrioformis]|uniref:YihY family inner membrane protein n=1 Tax=Oxalobacter vibrioformis TaxID=933080 RepID=A0A9E9P2T6_9BURK|nr:YhjD/YihY/BrkB family envelope integrity protein [Oxalobacter vibrioformis]WAW10257.1 YihY family inner membrane protein [Oxalobacter vibrioformis]
MPNPIDNLHAKNRHLQRLIDLAQYVWRRVDEERLTQVAGNITYTLILGIVPAVAVALAIFTRFPQFEMLQKMVEIYFTRGMIPPGMAKGILDNLTLFASKASGVSIVSSLAMLFTTAMMFDLIETTFNRIWGVQEPRPIIRRFIMYLFIATLGPLLLGGSLYLTSYLYLAARGIVGGLPYLKGIWPIFFLGGISTTAFTLLYRFVPYRQILWKDALWGGVFASVAFEIAKRLFAIFVMQFASYQKIYGAIAIIPMFLLWLYVSSLIMLFGAVLTSSLPDFRSGRWRRVVTPGSQYADALFIIRTLFYARSEKNKSVGWTRLQRHASLSSAELEGMLLTMQEKGWVDHIQRRARIIFRRRRKAIRRALDEWRWVGNARKITLADVYVLFVFQPEEEDELSQKITCLIEENLDQSLSDYFDELDKNDPSSTPPGFS